MGGNLGRAALSVLAAAALAAAPGSVASAAGDPVLSDLVGPLGLALGEDGSLYVNDAFAGELVRLDKHGNRTVLASGELGGGVDVQGRNVVFTSSAPPEAEGEQGDTLLVAVTPNGKTTTIASLLDHERAANPDADQTYGLVGLDADCVAEFPEPVQSYASSYSGAVESNPYAVTFSRGRYFVADAAGNSVLSVSRDGRVETLAVLPPVEVTLTEDLVAGLEEMLLEPFGPLDLSCAVGATWLAEPVPTDVEVGPDGFLYVSSLPGLPEAPGSGGVFRVDPDTGAVERIASGGSGATDLAVTSDGTVYVAELFGGRISVVSGGALLTHTELMTPSAIEVGRDGTLYVTTGLFGPGASVVTLTP